MDHKVKVKPIALTDPKWSVATAKPGDEVELSVTAKGLEAGQTVEFLIRDERGTIALIKKPTVAGDKHSAKWVVPNAPGSTTLTFDAILREKPTPKNGQITSRGRVASPKLTLSSFTVAIASVDDAFVPKQEKLHAKLKVVNPSAVALKGRIEIWGERYPSGKPLWADTWNPVTGDSQWDTWDGKGNDGTLSGKYISPEFSPYRVRVIIGTDDASVKDPHGAGLGKVAIAEHAFEVKFSNIELRIQSGLPGGVTTALGSLLGIEPRAAGGTFAATGRLPKPTEKGRIRIAGVRHNIIGEALNQGESNAAPGGWQQRLGDPYMDTDDSPPLAGALGKTKFQIDSAIYTRPEIPIEFVARLTSRDPAKNTGDHPGLFEKEAVGHAVFDVTVDDIYLDALYTAGTPEATYLLSAATTVKRGTDTAPFKSGVNPQITYWQHRFKIPANGHREITTPNAYSTGNNELTVYLNRTKLELGADKDYVEVNANKIKLKEKLSSLNDIVWIMRVPSAAHGTAIANWKSFPVGDNTHDHYGGIRGKAPNPELLDKFSAAPAGTEPIVGKGGAWPYDANIKLDPDKVVALRERVESVAMESGANQGLAGIIFSPSYVAGDGYELQAALAPAPYERSMGATPGKPKHKGRTGPMNVWRVCSITKSFKLPAKGTNGLGATVGINDPPLAGPGKRNDPGDGNGMNVSNLNTLGQNAFNEWVVPIPGAPVAPGEPHQNVPLATYIATHKGQNAANGVVGFDPALTAAGITNAFVLWDHYRQQLPPGIPPNRVNVASNRIATTPVNTPPATAMANVNAAIAAHNTAVGGPGGADAALTAPAALPIFGGTAQAYVNWIKGIVRSAAHAYLDAITPQVNPPRSMATIRWPLYFAPAWATAAGGGITTGLGTAGFCRGNNQSFFATDPTAGNPDTFEHEMGHSVHLCHFSTGSPRNTCWKHHDHGYAQCKMGYYNQPNGTFYNPPLPAGTVGPLININTGARNLFCAKCLLKMRGWNEMVLPCNWTHPDVF